MHQSWQTPKEWQVTVGRSLGKVLENVLVHAGVSQYFELVSFPDEETYQIKIVRLDPMGISFYEGTKSRGFEFLRVGIKHPDIITITIFDHLGERKAELRFYKSPKKLTKKVKKVLEESLCVFWMEHIRS